MNDSSALATSSTADIVAGNLAFLRPRPVQLAQQVPVSSAKNLGAFGGADTHPDNRKFRVFRAPRPQNLVKGGLARMIGGDAGAGSANIMARCNKSDCILRQMR